MKGFIVYPTYRILNGVPYICLFGRLENGHSFVTLNSFKPYFFIRKSDLKKAKRIERFESEEITFKDFDGKDVTKIILDSPKEVPEIRKRFEEEGIKCYEADVRFAYRFLIDNGLLGAIDIEGDYDSSGEIDRVYKEPEIRPATFTPKLNVLAIDIETNARTSQIYSISFYSEKYKGVLIHSEKELKNVTCCMSEEILLNMFVDKIKELDPDVITGWNVIDFDLETIKKRFKKYGIPFCLGRDNSQCKIKNEKSYFRSSNVDMPGRMVLDGIALLKSSFIKMDSYKLDDVAEHYLGEKKLVEFKDKKKEIIEMFKKDPQRLADYNLKDSELVYRILEKSDILNLTMQRSLLTGMPLDRVGGSIASLDQLYLREARKRGIVCPSGSYNVKEEKIRGGYVKESEPGIYDYILVLDFKSLYPSIIRTFNIDPASFVLSCKGNVVKAPNGACFKNEEGILPTIIQRLWDARDKARKEENELARYAIKILMNSFFGVMASPACRFFSLDVANAITHFGQHLIKLTAKKIEERGYHVLYIDTDSALTISKAKSLEEANEIGEILQKEINEFYHDHIQKEYKRKSHLELEYEKCFVKFIMPKLRGQDIGAKKRYAGLIIKDGKEKIVVTGMEFVRSDWTELAKKFQMELLEMIFHDKDPIPYITKTVKDLLDGKLDSLLVYKKSIRKELEEYTKTTPPHVKAARKLGKVEGSVVEYLMTSDGPEPIQKIHHPIDYEHYIDKQIKPIAESILVFFNKNFDDVIKKKGQTSLSSFA